MTTERSRWLLLGVAAAALVVHSLVYNFVTDDAYITFVYSRNFAEHHELVFNLGQYVEGYTNFLWALLLGLGMMVKIPPEILARVLGTLCGVATLYVTFRTTERVLGRKTPWATLPAVLLAASSGFACWSSGGLETQLFTLLVTTALWGLVTAEDAGGERALWWTGIVLALAAMTRPEALFIAAVIGAVRIICNVVGKRRVVGKSELIAAACFLGVWAPWFAWRYWYYGWPFPNPYYVKAHGPWMPPALAEEMRHGGQYYVWAWLQQTKLVYIFPIPLLGLVIARPRTPRFALCLASALIAAVYIPYTISVGGDFMGLHRFIMPLFVLAAFAVTLGLEWSVSQIPGKHDDRVQHIAAWASAGLLVAAFSFTQARLTVASTKPGNYRADHGIDTPAFLITYTEDRATIGRAMEKCFLPTDFSIVGGAGAQPYYGRMRAIDVFGLVSERVAHEEPRIRARAGHTKFARDTLLAEYSPTFVFSCYALHDKPTPPALNCATGSWLSKGYELVTMKIPGLKQSGEYYTFLAKKDRHFDCPGRVK